MAGNLMIAAVLTAFLPLAGPPSADNPLAGPTVESATTAATKTLVRQGFNGTVEILPVEADVAAIDLLELNPEQRKQFERLKAERSALFGKAIRENLDLLMELGGVNPKEQAGEFLDLLTRIGEVLSEYRARGSMMREMAPYLTNEQRREVRSLVGEYVLARAEAIRREPGADASPAAIAIRMQVETLGEMAKASIESAVAMGSAEFELISQRLGLTPDQRAKIQKLYEPIAIQELQGRKVAPIAKVRVFFEISHLLTKEQMAALAEYTREEKKAAMDTRESNSDPMKMEADR